MKRILMLADMHTGADVSPAPSGARLDYKGGTLNPNPLQLDVLNPKWQEMCNDGPYDDVVVNGDLVDGDNYRGGNKGVWTPDFDLQAEAAAKLLLMIPLSPGGKIYIISGTPYHRKANPNMDAAVAKEINARGGSAEFLGDESILKIENCKFHVSHTIGGGMYKGTTLNREIMYSVLNEHDVVGIFRGHIHDFSMYYDGYRFAVVIPPWKGRDEFLTKFGLKYSCEIGWVELLVDGKEWDIKPHLTKLVGEIEEKRI